MIIGIHGKARSGKDTFADFFTSLCSNSVKFAFADPIYDIVDIMFHMDSRNVQDKEEVIPEWGLSLRAMLQTIGTEMARVSVDKDIWIKNMSLRIKNSSAKHVIISDVRFDNEADYIRENGLLVRIHRPDCTSVRNHCSENGITKKSTDWMVLNTSDLKNLRRQAHALYTHIYDVSLPEQDRAAL